CDKCFGKMHALASAVANVSFSCAGSTPARADNTTPTASTLLLRKSNQGALAPREAWDHPRLLRSHRAPSDRCDDRHARSLCAAAAEAGKWKLFRTPPPAEPRR